MMIRKFRCSEMTIKISRKNSGDFLKKFKKRVDKSICFWYYIWVVDAAMAQSVERVLGKDEVPGSNPGSSSRKKDFAL